MNDLVAVRIPPLSVGPVPVLWRDHPFSARLRRYAAVEGQSIADIVAACARDLPQSFVNSGVVTINGEPVPRAMWRHVRPRARSDRAVIVSLHILQGGGGGGGKSTLMTVASIAILLAATLASAGTLAPILGAAFAGGTLGASLLGAGISIIGSLALRALAPPPSADALAQETPGGGLGGQAGSLVGNVLARGGDIPRVCGTHRLFPPLAVPPLIDIDGDDEVAEGVYVMAGPHKLEDIKFGDVLASSLSDVETQTIEGFGDDAALTLVTRYGYTDNVGQQAPLHAIKTDGSADLLTQGTPTNDLPFFQTFRSRLAPDEIWLAVQFPTGMTYMAATGTGVAVSARVRLRRQGTFAWYNLPEFIFQHTNAQPISKFLKLKFATAGAAVLPPSERGLIGAVATVPMRLDTVFGNHAGAGGVNDDRANDGDLETRIQRIIQTDMYYGGSFTSPNKTREITRVEVWPSGESTATWEFGNTNNLTIDLYYKNGATPASGTDGTLHSSVDITNGTNATRPVVFSGLSITADHVFFRIRPTAGGTGTFYVGELKLFGSDIWHSWLADDYFRTTALTSLTTSSEEYLRSANYTTTNIRNVNLYKDRAEVYLAASTFEPGVYDVEVMFSSAYRSSAFTISTYVSTARSRVANFFGWAVSGTLVVFETPANFSARPVLSRVSSVVNDLPVAQGAGLAVIAVKTKRPTDNVSVLASGYVNRWNGLSAFNDIGISNNPADHYYDVLAGDLNANALPAALINTTSLSDWWLHCQNKNYQVNAVFEGRTVFDALSVIAACGYGRPWQSEKWGVTIDRDRSADTPVQVFSPRNMRGFRWEKAFPRLPSGLRVRFDDKEQSYQEREIIVLRSGATDDGNYEDVRYDGLVTQAEVTRRAQFDLGQVTQRPVAYSGEVSLEHIVAARGELVGVQYDVITRAAGFARIKSVTTSGGNVTGLELDGTIEIDPAKAARYGVAIRRLDQSQLVKEIVVPAAATNTTTITFSNPFVNPGSSVLAADCLIVAGGLGSEQKRLVVTNVIPRNAFTAMVNFCDEAPSLFS